jgi:hypothetical protein
MKITKAKLKQIISEELSSMSEGGAQGHYEGGAGEVDPVVAAIAKVEDLRGLIENGDPGGEGALAAIDELWDHLQGMLTVPSNEVPMSRM